MTTVKQFVGDVKSMKRQTMDSTFTKEEAEKKSTDTRVAPK